MTCGEMRCYILPRILPHVAVHRDSHQPTFPLGPLLPSRLTTLLLSKKETQAGFLVHGTCCFLSPTIWIQDVQSRACSKVSQTP